MILNRAKTILALSAVQALMAINMSDDAEFTRIYLTINKLIAEVSNHGLADGYLICRICEEGFEQCLKGTEEIYAV